MKHILPTWLNLNRLTWILVSIFVILSFWQIWSYLEHRKSLSEINTSRMSTPKINSSINKERIRTSPYFGQYLPDDEKAIQQSDLDITLVGVLYSENPNDSQIIVRQSNREEKYFHINSTLPGGAVVKKITENSVIVLFDGKLQKLTLPKDSLSFEAKPKAKLIKE